MRFAGTALSLIAACAAFVACRRAYDEPPVASLSSSPAIEERFDTLRARWIDATPAQRAAMGPDFNALMIELGKKGDGLEPLARAYLAMSFLYGGVPAAAEATSRPLIDGPPGVANDLGMLVKGAAARKLGRSHEAIELLRPLIGKLIDPFARPLLYEEITESFLDQGRWDDAIVYAEGWLRSATGSEKKEARLAVARVLRRMPEAVALHLLEADALAPPEAKRSPDLMVILSARVEEGSAVIASDAGSTDGAVARSTDAATPSVALTPTIVPTYLPVRFDPRTIAVLVPSTAPGFALAATAVVRAAASVASPGLTLQGDAGVAPNALAHRVAVFDTGGTALGVTKALDAAEREGAGVIIGGVTEAEANALAGAAQLRRIAAVLVRRPTAIPKLASGERQVWIALGGTADEDSKAALAAATADVAIVDPWPEPGTNPESTDPLRARCDAAPKVAGATAFPIAAWRAKKVSSIVILGDARCARRVADELADVTGYRPTLVLAPSALELAHVSLPFARSIVGVGVLPAGDAAPKELRALWLDQSGPVGLFNALGHDAAVLAAAAMPGDLLATAETAALQKARALTVTRLIAAKGDLWTTTATNASSSGTIPPALSPRQVAAGTAIKPSWLSP